MAVVVHALRAGGWSCLSAATNVTVRLASDGDEAALQAVVASCRGMEGFGYGLSPAGLVARSATPHRSVRVWLAEESGGHAVAAAGLAQVVASRGDRWSIPFVLVSPSSRRRGLATALLRELLREAASTGAGFVRAETLTTWSDAAAFWSRLALRLDAGGMESYYEAP